MTLPSIHGATDNLMPLMMNPQIVNKTHGMNKRALQLKKWCATLPILEGEPDFDFSMVSGDASFRRYFRICCGATEQSNSADFSYIAVDAPVAHENSEQFIKVAGLFHSIGACCPKVIGQDLAQGFMLLSDLGDRQLLDELNADRVNELYGLAFDELLKIQAFGLDRAATGNQVSPISTCKAWPSFLPEYDHQKLAEEMALFQKWFVALLLDMSLNENEHLLIEQTQAEVLARVTKQQKVIVHRDFHSRNLMLIEENGTDKIALIDFQDAVIGPITYDAVSLLKDCYIEWPDEQKEKCLKTYYQQLVDQKVLDDSYQSNHSFKNFREGFELMGLQRHLKVLGIFARLSLRDGKHEYLKDLPLTFSYVEKALATLPEFAGFTELFLEKIKPKFETLSFLQISDKS